MPLDEALAAKILKAVDDGFEAQIEYTKTLVRYPSRRGEEHAVQDFIFQEMRRRGLTMERFAMDEEAIKRHPGGSPFSDTHSKAPIVVGIHRPKAETGRSLIMQGHIDVVPEGPEAMWTSPPYEPRIDGDWFYGRGAGDMKAGHGSMLAVLDAFKAIGMQPASTIYVQSVVEEESTGNGALQCHLRGYKADAAIIPEPSGGKVTRANVGVVWFQIDVAGFPVHVREAGNGQNAIEAAFGVIRKLRELEAQWNEKAKDDAWFKDQAHPINLNVGKIKGGDWASSVPAWCTVDCRIAIYPGEKPETMMRAIEDAVARATREDRFLANNPPRVTWNGFTTEGYVLEPGSEAEAVLARAHERATGETLLPQLIPAYLDGRVYALFDKIPTLNYGPYCELSHGFDERFSIASLKKSTGAMALFVAEWCGLEAI
ncbi:ArgE/DapE family deacylase [Phreatobacter aquaticus]|uniref:ArgE/DapE family deacylase n=1 Tax=Phreatobacter aquaticus TaxID=2570229 RepID=A0A4D7QMP6_9HYPH|nr:ArgE/DapE family deacylase [Phreatobacter aquaticus]QCK86899.1 ArgE/DapE family deacylase [Phreatobacter aquaticus]